MKTLFRIRIRIGTPMSRIWLLSLLIIILMLIISCASGPPVYENESPAFSIQYPKSWSISQPGGKIYFKAVTGEYDTPILQVQKAEITAKATHKSLANDLCEYYKNTWKAKSCETLYIKDVKLADETPAIEIALKWKHPAVLLFVCHIFVKKGNTAISVSVSDFSEIEEKYKKYMYSLEIE